MNQYGGRPFRQPAAAGVVESVALPIDGLESLCQQASALLVHQRDSVGEAQNIDRPLRLQVSSEDQSDLDLEGVALADRRFAGDGRSEARINRLRESFLDQHLLDR